jgi:hypothetical protein
MIDEITTRERERMEETLKSNLIFFFHLREDRRVRDGNSFHTGPGRLKQKTIRLSSYLAGASRGVAGVE